MISNFIFNNLNKNFLKVIIQYNNHNNLTKIIKINFNSNNSINSFHKIINISTINSQIFNIWINNINNNIIPKLKLRIKLIIITKSIQTQIICKINTSSILKINNNIIVQTNKINNNNNLWIKITIKIFSNNKLIVNLIINLKFLKNNNINKIKIYNKKVLYLTN